MYIIADNGEEYDDHGVLFIEVPTKLYNKFPDLIAKLILDYGISYGRPYIVAIAEKLEVVSVNNDFKTLAKLVDPATMVKDGKLKEDASALPYALLDYLVKAWPMAGHGGAALVPFLLHHAQLKKEGRGR